MEEIIQTQKMASWMHIPLAALLKVGLRYCHSIVSPCLRVTEQHIDLKPISKVAFSVYITLYQSLIIQFICLFAHLSLVSFCFSTILILVLMR